VSFLILHLFQLWTDYSARLEGILGLDGNIMHVVPLVPVEVQSRAVSLGLNLTRAVVQSMDQPQALQQPEIAPMSNSFEDEDLLDY
jgi:hypothetical protein